MTEGDAAQPQARPDVDTRAMADGSCLVIDGATGTNHAINATAAFVWERCDGAHTPAQIARELLEAFDAPADGVQGDVKAILAQFSQLGLLAQP